MAQASAGRVVPGGDRLGHPTRTAAVRRPVRDDVAKPRGREGPRQHAWRGERRARTRRRAAPGAPARAALPAGSRETGSAQASTTRSRRASAQGVGRDDPSWDRRQRDSRSLARSARRAPTRAAARSGVNISARREMTASHRSASRSIPAMSSPRVATLPSPRVCTAPGSLDSRETRACRVAGNIEIAPRLMRRRLEQFCPDVRSVDPDWREHGRGPSTCRPHRSAQPARWNGLGSPPPEGVSPHREGSQGDVDVGAFDGGASARRWAATRHPT